VPMADRQVTANLIAPRPWDSTILPILGLISSSKYCANPQQRCRVWRRGTQITGFLWGLCKAIMRRAGLGTHMFSVTPSRGLFNDRLRRLSEWPDMQDFVWCQLLKKRF
jgi:hypothetical protein